MQMCHSIKYSTPMREPTTSVPVGVPVPETTTTADEINKSMSVAVYLPMLLKPFMKPVSEMQLQIFLHLLNFTIYAVMQCGQHQRFQRKTC